jgi:hypothetical protein
VGLIVDPLQAETILQAGDADIIALGREFQRDANWAHSARLALGIASYDDWPVESGYWLNVRQRTIESLQRNGETPMDRYNGALQASPAV